MFRLVFGLVAAIAVSSGTQVYRSDTVQFERMPSLAASDPSQSLQSFADDSKRGYSPATFLFPPRTEKWPGCDDNAAVLLSAIY
jgi:hypothetical protein